ncbi:hypothetical protein PanWU01x14_271510 [Parasponia andersonii]|uniref:Uncharacterized protein n=1 Tax=Parasponia andersonii TaxID=3476 RepID=A0A2P5B4S1_PARAD|nr:hypothetical protein PanWU01x14_271510 [Parasponia andersonii]
MFIETLLLKKLKNFGGVKLRRPSASSFTQYLTEVEKKKVKEEGVEASSILVAATKTAKKVKGKTKEKVKILGQRKR